MEIGQWFLFIWIAMAMIKWIIIIVTVIETSVKYDKLETKVKTIVIDLLGGTIISSLVILLLWPKYLYAEKFDFFVYPDRKIQLFLIKFFIIRKKNADIKAARE